MRDMLCYRCTDVEPVVDAPLVEVVSAGQRSNLVLLLKITHTNNTTTVCVCVCTCMYCIYVEQQFIKPCNILGEPLNMTCIYSSPVIIPELVQIHKLRMDHE